MDDPKAGSKVAWNSHGGKVTASKDNPQFIVETDEGKKAAHKASALKKD
jgi:hypothetical protein